MNMVPLSTDRPEAPLFCDGLGDRVVAADGATGELLQILRIRPALTAVPSFEFALRERAARLANFRHAYYARVRRIDRVQIPAPGLAIVSDHIEGTRLSEILRVAHERQLQLDINAALCLIRQLVPAVALLHENAREVAHGLIAPERLIVTPHARLVIVEHVMAAAVEQLQFSRDRLWQDFRIALPPSAGLPRFDHRADVTGLGLVALALVLGRPVGAEEFPHRLGSLLNEARERTALGEQQSLSPPLRDWLARALQLDTRRAFASAPEALTALEEIVADDSMYVAAPVALETFLSGYIAALLEPLGSDPIPAPAPAVSVPQATAPLPPVAEPVAPPPVAKPAAPVVSAQPDTAYMPPPQVTTSPLGPSFANPAVQMSPTASGTPHDHGRHAANPLDPFAAPAGAPAITDLIASEDLPLARTGSGPTKPLFDPDAPFSLPLESLAPPPEPKPKSKAAKPKRSFKPPRIAVPKKAVLAVAALILVVVGGFYGSRFMAGSATPMPSMGTLVVQSNPAGVQVWVDGQDRGPTPARLSVTPGSHILELRGRGVPRVIPLNVPAGGEVSQYLEFANTPETGQLRVESQPPGAKVLVDGVDKGVAPLTVDGLLPGDHEVVLQTPLASARHVVSVQAGGTASIVAPVAPAAPAAGPVSGWLTVRAPFVLEIREEGRLLGTTDADRVMMAAGRHEIQLVADALGYKVMRVVNVLPGKVSSLVVDLPNGIVNVNAAPWAEVWIDGQRVGETPIGNLSVPIGPHEIVFRHPQFGEKRHAVSVTLGGPVRVSVDMKQ